MSNEKTSLAELFRKEGQSIYAFKAGDIIIRVEPIAVADERIIENMAGVGVVSTTKIDNSYRREPVEFIGIYNNLIYTRSLKPWAGFDKKHVSKATLEDCENGWALFEIPDGLTLEDCI